MLQLESLIVALRSERKTAILSNTHISCQVQVPMERIVVSLNLAILIMFCLSYFDELLLSMLSYSSWELICSHCSLRVYAESDKEPSELTKCLFVLH